MGGAAVADEDDRSGWRTGRARGHVLLQRDHEAAARNEAVRSECVGQWHGQSAAFTRPDRHSFWSGARIAERQTSLWMMSATLARPETGSLHVKASGIDSFFWRMKAVSASSIEGSSAGAS